MANPIGEAPKEAMNVAGWTAAAGGRLVLNAGAGLIHRVQPGYLPPEVVARQAILKRFERRLSVVSGIIDRDSSDDDLEVQAYMTADAMVDNGLVDEHGIVELRPVLPEDALRDPELSARRARAVELLQLAFEEDHNVMAVPSTHPIMPSRHTRSPIATADTWRAFAPELDGLAHQFRGDRDYSEGGLAMAALTGFGYERTMFGSGGVKLTGSPRVGNLLALQTVGERPEDNVLAWLGPRTAMAA